ncbi:flagellar protein FlgN [Salipiger bermudensis]|uniref:flagellar protein FlgN n=1 Tax=Salipiger bermudensis TaxID=344736 RepID=UPI001C99DD63|nr:flagellar protein FlgN [Salipiger bermudensis]MBY6003902.1 flagellar protein FlgN [Salipiger bermudensis]
MTDPVDDPLEALGRLLAQERACLLAGALDEIGPLMEAKAALISELREALPEDREALRQMHERMVRNQALFDQSLAGIRNAAERFGAMRRMRCSMDVYDSGGRRATIDLPATQKVERRA